MALLDEEEAWSRAGEAGAAPGVEIPWDGARNVGVWRSMGLEKFDSRLSGPIIFLFWSFWFASLV
jgi:hypothetical protein